MISCVWWRPTDALAWRLLHFVPSAPPCKVSGHHCTQLIVCWKPCSRVPVTVMPQMVHRTTQLSIESMRKTRWEKTAVREMMSLFWFVGWNLAWKSNCGENAKLTWLQATLNMELASVVLSKLEATTPGVLQHSIDGLVDWQVQGTRKNMKALWCYMMLLYHMRHQIKKKGTVVDRRFLINLQNYTSLFLYGDYSSSCESVSHQLQWDGIHHDSLLFFWRV